MTSILENEKVDWEHFWNAYKALSFSKESIDIIKEGISTSIILQKRIVQQAFAIIERKNIVNGSQFRYATVLSQGHDNLFLTPSGISKLGIFIMEICRTVYDKKKNLLIISENKEKETTLLLGLPNEMKNEFGTGFRRAKIQMELKTNYNGFEPNIIEIPTEHCKQFIETIHYILKNE